MPSDSPPHPSSSDPDREQPSDQPAEPPEDGDSGAPPDAVGAAPSGEPTAQRGLANPRIIAALCYAVPYIVSLVVLLSERRNRFVRFHAAQALLFFVAIPIIQVILFAALVAVGNTVGTGQPSVALGIVFIAGFLALGVGALLFWLRLLADCWAGQATVFPVLGAVAHLIEQLVTQAHREVSNSRPLRENSTIL